jgi:2-polyprenyl-3-methyl-5-hydroxy-6-metoxy-1,4-benzoquinol methylase
MEKDFQDSARNIIQDLYHLEWERTSSHKSRSEYLRFHKDRFNKTLLLCKRLMANRQVRVLDVGQSYLTKLLADEYKDVRTIGLDPTTDSGGHRSAVTDERDIPHIKFDLNNSRFPKRWPQLEHRFDLIVYSETIEHLTIAPEYSILFLSTLLTSKGVLLLTTPNAVSISKRLRLLLGENPFEQIRVISENPGHFREYTLSELSDIGCRCKLKVVYKEYINFSKDNNIFKMILKNLYPSFRESLVIAFQNKNSKMYD